MFKFPAPLFDRVGHIGGIECLIIDEKINFFGFDFGSDLVVSPLIENVEVMAEFAHRYMEQRDGSHDAKYWMDLVEYSKNYSSLTTSHLEARNVNTLQLRATAELIRSVAQEGVILGEVSVDYHLLYLLGAAGGWEGPDLDDVEELMSQISDRESTHSSFFIRSAAVELQEALNELVRACPDNWATLFGNLNVPIE